MAYYDRFTKNSHGKRDDWRDDEKTRRPKRDEGRAVPTEGRERRPYERREDGKDRRFHERRFSEGQIPGRGQRPYGQDEEGKRPYEGRPQRHGERAHGKRTAGRKGVLTRHGRSGMNTPPTRKGKTDAKGVLTKQGRRAANTAFTSAIRGNVDTARTGSLPSSRAE